MQNWIVEKYFYDQDQRKNKEHSLFSNVPTTHLARIESSIQAPLNLLRSRHITFGPPKIQNKCRLDVVFANNRKLPKYLCISAFSTHYASAVFLGNLSSIMDA